MRLLACPICGKMPKISAFGVNYKAECKPLFGRPHLVVYESWQMDVIKSWNNAVKEMWVVEEHK